MIPIETLQDLLERYNRLEGQYRRRNKMVDLCNEIYLLKRERKSGFLGNTTTEWRSRVAAEYWEVSSKGHNAIDIMTAVLAGHPPQFRCLMPGATSSNIPSRAEMFLDGAFRLNSRRQQLDLVKEIVLRTVKDGACGVRVYWTPNSVEVPTQTVENPDVPEGEPWVVQPHTTYTFPLVLDVIDIAKLYPGRRGQHGQPFTEIIYVQQRTPQDIIDEWEEIEGADLGQLKKEHPEKQRDQAEIDYFEWWGQDAQGQVHYAIATRAGFILKPQPIDYPTIPFVITSFKHVNHPDRALENLPFLYPVFEALEKCEYLKSRSYRLIDLYSNLVPYHAGEMPLEQIDATWGKIIELGPKEDIRFPQWPGQSPDVYKEIQEVEASIAEGTFSEAMYGQISSRVSGYALSQVIGADTLRTDIPRGNLELAFSSIADLIFGLMQKYSPDTHLAVVSEIKHRKLSAMLAGNETRLLVVSTYVKPKQTNDEVRLATIGSQIASLPNPPVSMRYILEHYFGVAQPEEELARKLDEDAMKDPIIRMHALIEVLQEAGSPYVGILLGQLQEAMGQAAQPPGGPAQPGMPSPAGMEQLGMGLPQAVGGNPPVVGPSGNPAMEQGMTPEAALFGGPREAI